MKPGVTPLTMEVRPPQSPQSSHMNIGLAGSAFSLGKMRSMVSNELSQARKACSPT